jgi:hypothetical protein
MQRLSTATDHSGVEAMQIHTTAPLEDPRKARTLYRELEDIGYDGGFSFEAKHDPFLPLALASEHTSTLRLGTAIAIAFARNPMNLANLGYDMQAISGGRFVLGLGSQVRPHIEKRFSCTWSHPAERMKEIVEAIKAIWDCWEGRRPLNFEGRFYTHTLMIPAFDPGPNPYGPPPIFTGGFGPLMTAVAGEVADGFIAHPFNTRRSLLENTLPALQKGPRARRTHACRSGGHLLDAGGHRGHRRTVRRLAARGAQATRVLRLDARLRTHPRLPRLGGAAHGAEPSLESRPVGRHDRPDRRHSPRRDRRRRRAHEIAGKLRARLEGIADGVSITHNRCPDPHHWADVVRDLKMTA